MAARSTCALFALDINDMDAPKLILVGGPNGAGKSTFALSHANSTGISYLGADQIAAERNPENPASKKIDAAREFLTSFNQSILNRQSLIVESTLSGKTVRK